VSLADGSATLWWSTLQDDGYRLVAKASAGEPFEVVDPFKMSFDPVELLDL
jgi:hypothetical protein